MSLTEFGHCNSALWRVVHSSQGPQLMYQLIIEIICGINLDVLKIGYKEQEGSNILSKELKESKCTINCYIFESKKGFWV